MRSVKLSDWYLSDFCMQMNLLITSGVSPEESLEILRTEERDRKAAAVLERVRTCMQSGEPLGLSLQESGAFPRYLTDLTELGERTGNLDAVLHSLAVHYERQAQISRSIRSAVVYPSVLLIMMLAVVVTLLVKVLPVFENVYAQLGASMSGPSAAFLRWGRALTGAWPALLTVLAVLAAALWLFAVQKKRRTGSRWAFLPVSMRQKIAAERFSAAMAMAMKSGFDADEAMEMAQTICADGETEKRIRTCREQTAAGVPMAKALEQTGLFSSMSCRLLAVGVRTGRTDGVLEEIAGRLHREIDDSMDRLIAGIEPALVIALCVIVGLILLSVMLPLAGLLSAMG